MKTYLAVILTLILITLVAATGIMYRMYTKSQPVPLDPETVQNMDLTNETTQSLEKKVNPDNIESPDLPTPTPGKVTGKLCYPSEQIPAMDLYIQFTATNVLTHITTAQNQQTFTIDNVAPGDYAAFAYPKNSSELGGGYTKAVPCGLLASCKDHTLIKFTVESAKTTSGIDICDWYGADIPAKP